MSAGPGSHDTTHHEGAEDIAIIGMAGRFPGAADVDALWQLLLAGREGIEDLSLEQLAAAGVDEATASAPDYVRRGALLADWDCFDPALFGISPREAQVMDPQQRLLLECAWHALEDAAWEPRQFSAAQRRSNAPSNETEETDTAAGRIAVFTGIGGSHYLIQQLLPRPEVIQQLGYKTVQFGNDPAFAATQLAFRLDLHGPALTLNCACSTSLVAVHLACQSLLRGECGLALAGGSQIARGHGQGYLHQSGGILSTDGHCRPLDAAASGTVSGSGVALVALRRLADARAQGDRILAVIKAVAVNNDGGTKVGFAAPSPQGQEQVIRAALSQAGVSPDQLGYHECHGTGTVLGDPIEIQSLGQAHAALRRATPSTQAVSSHSVALGSLKANTGHLGAAAGVSGLIKACLALAREQIPPLALFQQENPQLQLSRWSFAVPTQAQAWPRGEQPRYASVSAFGMGGTNAHAVLAEAPPRPRLDSARHWHVLPLSAASAAQGEQLQSRVLKQLQGADNARLADAAYSLARGRCALDWRGFVLSHSDGRRSTDLGWQPLPQRAPRVALIFPGQGAQFPGMSRGLYQGEAAFGAALDLCLNRLQRQQPRLAQELRRLLLLDGRTLSGNAWQAAAQQLEHTLLAQTALFCHGYASAALWRAWGVEAEALLGHSIGEYLAACWSGALSLDQALALVVCRAQWMARAPTGRMLAVSCSASAMQALLAQHPQWSGLEIAVVNSAHSVVLAGPAAAIAAWEKQLQRQGLAATPLHTAHAFHSASMASAAQALAQDWAQLGLHWQAPDRPCLSNLTGGWIRPPDSAHNPDANNPLPDWASADYWSAHLRQPVRFADNLQCLLDAGYDTFIDAGPGQSMSRLLRGPWKLAAQQVLSSAAAPQRDAQGRWLPGADELSLSHSLGLLWQRGYGRDQGWTLNRRYQGEARQALSLPGYPFLRQRCGFSGVAPAAQVSQAALTASSAETPAPSKEIRQYQRQWRPLSAAAAASHSAASTLPKHCLLLGPADGELDQLQQRLQAQGCQVWRLLPGETFQAPAAEQPGRLNPTQMADYQDLTLWLAELLDSADLSSNDSSPNDSSSGVALIWAWPLSASDTAEAAELVGEVEGLAQQLLALSQGLLQSPWPGDGAAPAQWPLLVLSRQGMSVAGETLHPAAATLSAALQVLAQEQENLRCRWLDLGPPHPRHSHLLQQQLAALVQPDENDSGPELGLALRAGQFWQAHWTALEATPSPWHWQPGNYLITGANGGIGYSFALNLIESSTRESAAKANDVPSQLWLLSRSGLSSSQVEGLNQAQAEAAKQGVRWQWRELQADLSAAGAWQEQLRDWQQQSGPVRGLIHAAGTPGGALLARQNLALLQQTQGSKLAALAQLQPVVDFARLDFALLCSSQNGLKGGIGRFDYALANAALDAWAQRLALEYWEPQQGRPRVLSVNWPAWSEVGMAARSSAQNSPKQSDSGQISPQQALEQFPLLLGQGQSQILLSRLPPQQILLSPETVRAQRWQQLQPACSTPSATTEDDPVQANPIQARPGHLAPLVAPADALETALCTLWSELLGVAPVGRDDDFFVLGGHSLLMVQLGVRLREDYGLVLAPQQLFASLTVAAQAQLLRQHLGPQTAAEASEVVVAESVATVLADVEDGGDRDEDMDDANELAQLEAEADDLEVALERDLTTGLEDILAALEGMSAQEVEALLQEAGGVMVGDDLEGKG